MLKVEDYGKLRRAHRDGMSIRQIARTYGHSRRSVRKALQHAEPPPLRRDEAAHRPKLIDAYCERIVEILTEDESVPRKQRHTAMRIFERLQEEGYTGGYDQVRRYVAGHRQDRRETFVPLRHDPGQRAESDFGHIYVDFPDGRKLVPVLLITWAYSNKTFAVAMPTERVEAILGGTVEAFEFFGCVPKELWWDNPKTVAKTILQGRERRLHDRYQALANHYNFEPLFCMPARGNEKPHVENRVKLLQRRWGTPIPHVKDLAELNAMLRAHCEKDVDRTVQGRNDPIATMFQREPAEALTLPDHRFDACIREDRKVSKYQTLAFDSCTYSVPRRYAFSTVTLKAYVDRIDVVQGGQTIASHARSYEPGTQCLEPLHFLATLETKPAYLDHTDVFRSWQLPAEFQELRNKLESHHGPRPGARQYIRVLQLLAEHPLRRVQQAVRDRRGQVVPTADAIIRRCEQIRIHDARENVDSGDDVPESIPTVDVPLPDLTLFDRLLDQGEREDGQNGSTSSFESEPQATTFTHDAGGVRQIGERGVGERRGVFGIPASTHGAGIGYTCFECSAVSNPECQLSCGEGLGHV